MTPLMPPCRWRVPARPPASCSRRWTGCFATAGRAATMSDATVTDLGIQLTEPPSHTQWDHTQLHTDMVITLEPSIGYISSDGEQRMMVAEENLIITKNGAELLTRRAPRELPVIGGGTT